MEQLSAMQARNQLPEKACQCICRHVCGNVHTPFAVGGASRCLSKHIFIQAPACSVAPGSDGQQEPLAE